MHECDIVAIKITIVTSPRGSGLVGAGFGCRHAAAVAVGHGGHETKISTAKGAAGSAAARQVSGATACPGHEVRMVGLNHQANASFVCKDDLGRLR